MKFEVFGPYFLNTRTIIKKEHVITMREVIAASEYGGVLSTAPGCYIFGIKPSGAQRIIPWYVGKAERQPVMKEATNDQHLQLYNEIFDGYKNGNPVLYFLPSTTPKGRATTLAKAGGKKPAIEFLEDWLIAACLKTNPGLWNIKKTRLLRDLYVRGIFNPSQGDLNSSAASFKKCIGV
ncbi:hypothetical protein [Pollutimonas bauzanensis]|uniref:Uncharacterized protein n=1 Tax=Pollutimonas bauzanensis TaxID=658167 RepID=A0A1M6C289_9BURK|nr:hypothetical protein [Pollutimonas bauzanensis]SHI55073.1 hypothetical protein SAMN04488135_1325 [Pollutimonas bauzanensis]